MYFRLLSRKPISSCPISKKLLPLRTGGPFSTKLHPCSGEFADRGSVRSAFSGTGEPAKKKGEQICVDVIFDGHLSSFSFYLFVLLLPRRRGRIEWAGGLLHSLRGWVGEVKGGRGAQVRQAPQLGDGGTRGRRRGDEDGDFVGGGGTRRGRGQQTRGDSRKEVVSELTLASLSFCWVPSVASFALPFIFLGSLARASWESSRSFRFLLFSQNRLLRVLMYFFFLSEKERRKRRRRRAE